MSMDSGTPVGRDLAYRRLLEQELNFAFLSQQLKEGIIDDPEENADLYPPLVGITSRVEVHVQLNMQQGFKVYFEVGGDWIEGFYYDYDLDRDAHRQENHEFRLTDDQMALVVEVFGLEKYSY